MRKICFVTGTRAEFGLLSGLMRLVQDSNTTGLQVVVTNMHLSPEYGETWREIEAAGFTIDYKVSMLEDGASDALGTVYAMSRGLSGMAEAFSTMQPDIIVLLGDRYEMLAAASAALILRIPVVHISGGAISEGAYDDAIRHAVTKMSHLHFTEAAPYRHRVIQMGEEPDRVFNVGALGVENILKRELLSKEAIEESIGFSLSGDTILVTYHPVTLGDYSPDQDIAEFLSALAARPDLRIVFTMPNSDTGSSIISSAIRDFVARSGERAIVFKSLGMLRYLSVMKYATAVVGNSSSGIVEAPSFGIPTLDIGNRQKGRISAESVVHCGPGHESILNGLDKVLSQEFRSFCKTVRNPYEQPDTAGQIFKVISTFPLDGLIQKHFYDLNP